MLDSDGAEHRRLRTLVRDAFAPHYIARLEPRVQVVADQLLDRLAQQGRVDLVADYAVPLPLTLIAEILGVPERDRFRFRRWFSSLVELSASEQPGLLVLLKLPQVILMMRFLRRLISERPPMCCASNSARALVTARRRGAKRLPGSRRLDRPSRPCI